MHYSLWGRKKSDSTEHTRARALQEVLVGYPFYT